METAAPSRVRRTGKPTAEEAADYGALLKTVREQGLLRRTHAFYAAVGTALSLALAATISGLIFAGNTWTQVLIATVLAVVLTQFAFLGHEASHRQIFASKKANDFVGRLIATLVVGISYSWWMNKHTRHHANPNRIAHDPDIDGEVIVFQPEKAAGKGRLHSWFLRHQGTLFFPMLLLEGVNLHYQGLRYLLDRRNEVSGRATELALLAVRLLALPAVAFAVLPPVSAIGFLLVQVSLFGLYMGASFAPNHKGMPQVPSALKLSFLHKQVLTSRNIRGRGMTALFGGLNHQIEHHLFPNMPRPHLARAARIVREYCAKLNVPYTSVSLASSYRTVLRHLNAVGHPDRDLFQCPMVTAYGRT